MEHFFQEAFQGDDVPIFWYETVPVNQNSAFVPYTSTPINQVGLKNPCNVFNTGNMNKRMVKFLRRSWPAVRTETGETKRERSIRHMVNERMRREKLRNSYSALHSVLPPGTKTDKKSIVQVAAKMIEELWRYKEMLERRKKELSRNFAATNEEKVERTKIRVRVDNPVSGADSVLEVLKCLNNLGTNTISIQSKLSDHEFLALLDIETEIDGAEVEKFVQRRLHEVERKLLG
ncbi:HLH domain-containing protein [Cephalotus follicularis]|uniref:HLH domain-containing protein n=1 Tax=Cephalotus follicularis TaxID=3775 RepID=A0A1Q3BNL3_CEPFO|nr:HLH domain-containing protein [Cephalotus follicularis]